MRGYRMVSLVPSGDTFIGWFEDGAFTDAFGPVYHGDLNDEMDRPTFLDRAEALIANSDNQDKDAEYLNREETDYRIVRDEPII